MNNIKFPQINLIFDRRKVATPTIKSSVEVRICHDYKQKFISTGIKLNSTQWKNGKIINHPDIASISDILVKLVSNIRQIISDMIDEGFIDLNAIPYRLEKIDEKELTFIDFCEQRAVIRKYGKKKDTQERYDRFLKQFKDWGKIKYFEDVTDSNIILYDRFLIDRGMKPYSKWNNYHRFVDSFIIDAIEEGHLKRNPYKWLNIPKEQESLGLERCLTPEEFKKIRDVAMPTKCLERVRDLFVFQTYTCLRYSDLRNFDAGKIQIIKDTPVYIEDSIKTSKPFTIPLLPPAVEVLEKYNKKLPIISNPKYNQYLKVVAQAAGIEKPISSHWARHTGATMLLNNGAEMKIITKVCGHSSTKITEQVYAKLLNETVVDAILKIQEKI